MLDLVPGCDVVIEEKPFKVVRTNSLKSREHNNEFIRI